MKRILLYGPLILLLLFSCEKISEKGEAGNSLIRFYGDAFHDKGVSIAPTSNGYIICGKLTILERGVNELGSSVIESSTEDIGVIGTDLNGTQKWSLNLGGDNFDEGRKVLRVSDGSFLIVGTVTNGTGVTMNRDLFIAKIDQGGSVAWSKSFGGGGNQEANDVVETPGGDFIITGSTDVENIQNENSSGRLDILFFKIDRNGQLLSSSSYGFRGDEYGHRIIRDKADGYLIMGTTDNSVSALGDKDIILVRIDKDLNITDTRIYGTDKNEVASDIELVEDGYILTGNKIISNESFNGIFIKISSGSLDQPYQIKDISDISASVEINSITSYSEGVFLLCGSIGTRQSADMLYLFVDGQGKEVTRPLRMTFGGAGYQGAFDAAVESDGKIVSVGVNTYETNSLITLLKFTPKTK